MNYFSNLIKVAVFSFFVVSLSGCKGLELCVEVPDGAGVGSIALPFCSE